MTDTCSANWSLALSFVSTYLSVLPCIDKRHAPNETCFHMHCVFTALNKLFKILILNLMSAGLNQFSIPDVITDVTRFFTSLQIFSFHLRDISAKNFQDKKMHKMFHRLNSTSIDSLCYNFLFDLRTFPREIINIIIINVIIITIIVTYYYCYSCVTFVYLAITAIYHSSIASEHY